MEHISMKHHFENFIHRKYFALAALSLVALLLIDAADAAAAKSEKDIALVLKKVGRVDVARQNGSKWLHAKKGMRLNSGNIIRTGDKSLAALIFSDDKSLLKIRSNSRVTLRGRRKQASVSKSIFLKLGELWTRVTKGNPFRVETPSGVAAVKGTEFYVSVDELGNMVVYCIEGVIELINRFGSVELHAGERGTAGPNSAPQKSIASLDEMPGWGKKGAQEKDIEIEFQNDAGDKKILKIKYR